MGGGRRWELVVSSSVDLRDDGTLVGLAGVLLAAGAKVPKHLVVAAHDIDHRAVVLPGASESLAEDLASAIEYRGGADPDDLPPWHPGWSAGADRSAFGFVLVNGLGRNASVIVYFDSLRFRAIVGEPFIGNRVGVLVSDGKVAGVPALEWACRVFDGLVATCGGLVSARLNSLEEREVRCRSVDGQLLHPNVRQGLVGPFWRTAFGERYVDLIGADAFASLPEGCCRLVAGRPVVEIYSHPDAWVAESGPGSLREVVIDRLGADLFFDPRHPDRAARTPWDF